MNYLLHIIKVNHINLRFPHKLMKIELFGNCRTYNHLLGLEEVVLHLLSHLYSWLSFLGPLEVELDLRYFHTTLQNYSIHMLQ